MSFFPNVLVGAVFVVNRNLDMREVNWLFTVDVRVLEFVFQNFSGEGLEMKCGGPGRCGWNNESHSSLW